MEYMHNLPQYVERKGSLLLRSNHCNFRKGVLNTNWHQMREAEPKDYDITNPNCYNLHKSTYGGFGCISREGVPVSEMKERMADLHKKADFEKKEIHKLMLDQAAFRNANWNRLQDKSATRRHTAHNNVMFLNTTHREDYKPSYSYTPKEITNVSIKPELKHRKTHSEFYDRTDHRRWYQNTWQDEYKVVKNNDGPSSTVVRGAAMKARKSPLPFFSPASRYSTNRSFTARLPVL